MCAVNSFVELVFTDTVWCILYHNNVLLLSGTWISSIREKKKFSDKIRMFHKR